MRVLFGCALGLGLLLAPTPGHAFTPLLFVSVIASSVAANGVGAVLANSGVGPAGAATRAAASPSGTGSVGPPASPRAKAHAPSRPSKIRQTRAAPPKVAHRT